MFNTFDFAANSSDLERDDMPDPAVIRRHLRLTVKNKLQLDKLAEICPEIPAVGESLHLIANGKYDFWTWTPHLVTLMKGHASDFYCSTWTMNRKNAVEMLEMFDAGKLGHLNLLTGLYFKRRETAVYATVMEGIQKRRGRYIAFRNHAKVLLLQQGSTFLTVEGSANLTANPRLEQYILTNDRGVYELHQGWMDKMLGRKNAK